MRCGHQVADGFGVVASGDLDGGLVGGAVDQEPVEDGLVHQASAVVVQAPVELVGAGEQVELGFQDGGALGELVVGVGQAGLEFLALSAEPGEAGTDLAGGPGGVGGQVEQVFLLPVQGGQFAGELIVQELAVGCGLGEDGFDVGADLGDESLGEALGGPVVLDGVFDVLDGQVGQVAAAWAAGQALEVAVGAAVADGVEVLHDRRIPASRANIDHIAVSSSGVYVIDAKHYQGLVKVDWEGGLFSPRRYKLLVGRRDCTKLVTGVERQVDLVRAAVDRHTVAGGEVPVVGVLAFFDAEWPVLFPPDKINEVRLEGSRSVRKLVRRAGPLSPEQVAATAVYLRSAFPEAAPPVR